MDKQNIGFTIILIALVLSLWFNIKAIFVSPKPSHDIQQYQNSIDSLDNIIEYKENEILLLNEKNSNLYSKIDSLDKEVITNKNKIKQIKNYYDKKIDSINNYTSNDITNYFTNRYK